MTGPGTAPPLRSATGTCLDCGSAVRDGGGDEPPALRLAAAEPDQARLLAFRAEHPRVIIGPGESDLVSPYSLCCRMA